ncbi:MAG: hypothetical protein HQL50_13795 [Magnetococcales bacterium]|nr:hypothetical protein [Magnetococcales bacterium]
MNDQKELDDTRRPLSRASRRIAGVVVGLVVLSGCVSWSPWSTFRTAPGFVHKQESAFLKTLRDPILCYEFSREEWHSDALLEELFRRYRSNKNLCSDYRYTIGGGRSKMLELDHNAELRTLFESRSPSGS